MGGFLFIETGPKLPLEPTVEPEAVDQVNWRMDKLQAGGGWTHTFGGGFIPSAAAVFLPDGTRKTGRDLELEYLLDLGGAERERLFPHGVRRSVAQEGHEFVDCIRLGQAPEVGPEEGLEGLAIAAAVYESAHCGQAVRVEEVRESRVDAYQRPVDQHWALV